MGKNTILWIIGIVFLVLLFYGQIKFPFTIIPSEHEEVFIEIYVTNSRDFTITDITFLPQTAIPIELAEVLEGKELDFKELAPGETKLLWESAMMDISLLEEYPKPLYFSIDLSGINSITQEPIIISAEAKEPVYFELKSECGTVISEDNTVLTLNKDLLDCETFGIMINAKNVTVDCQGHHITGSPNARIYDSSGKEECSMQFVLNQQVGPSGIVACGKSDDYTIKNCVIHENFPGFYSGAITNYGSKNGIIENNLIYNVHLGIMQWGSDIIRNNTFKDCYMGIWFDESSGNSVENNLFKNCEVAVEHFCGSHCARPSIPNSFIDNTFIDNNVFIHLKGNQYFTDIFRGNKLYFSNRNHKIFSFDSYLNYNGFSIGLPSYNIGLDFDTSNTLNDAPIYYLTEEDGAQEITGDIGLFYCRNCKNILIEDARITAGSEVGMFLYESSNIEVVNSEIKNNKAGIILYYSTNTTINAEFGNNEISFIEKIADGTNIICNNGICYQNICLKYRGMKNIVGTQCEDNALLHGCVASESFCKGADINRDGNVDGLDYSIWSTYEGTEGCDYLNNWCEGADINRDGNVDGLDYMVWSNSYGEINCNLDENIFIHCVNPDIEIPF